MYSISPDIACKEQQARVYVTRGYNILIYYAVVINLPHLRQAPSIHLAVIPTMIVMLLW